MRRRSNAIIAEDLNDYLNQLINQNKNSSSENVNENNLISYQLFDFDYLSLNDRGKNEKNNFDLLSSKQNYKIVLNDITKSFINRKRKNLIPIKFKKFKRKKKDFVTNIQIQNSSKSISCT